MAYQFKSKQVLFKHDPPPPPKKKKKKKKK
jgi:hypothetical protein